MFKILNPVAVGVSGRQSEVIELALTYGFRHLEVDLTEFQKRVEQQGLPAARRLFDSAKLAVASFELPFSLGIAEPEYRAALEALKPVAAIAQQLGAAVCWTQLEAGSDERPFHENFELHRKRLQEVGELLDGFGLRLAVGIQAAEAHRAPKAFQFIYQPDQLLLLLKTASTANVGLLLDTWDWFVGGGSLDQIRKLTANQVFSVRLGDLPAEVEPTAAADDQRAAPGEGGTFDIQAVVQHLVDIQYAGPITVAAHPKAFAGQRREVMVQKLSASLDELWAAAGLGKDGQPLPTAAKS
ncbi:MAG: sugar phosphate isomerase/epimerase [Pirellulales bacterium]